MEWPSLSPAQQRAAQLLDMGPEDFGNSQSDESDDDDDAPTQPSQGLESARSGSPTFDAGVAMFGEAPAPAPAPAPTPSGKLDARDEIVAIYQRHRPDKVSDVDQLLAEWVGEEETLLAKIRGKYGEQPQPPPSQPAEPEPEQGPGHAAGPASAFPHEALLTESWSKVRSPPFRHARSDSPTLLKNVCCAGA